MDAQHTKISLPVPPSQFEFIRDLLDAEKSVWIKKFTEDTGCDCEVEFVDGILILEGRYFLEVSRVRFPQGLFTGGCGLKPIPVF